MLDPIAVVAGVVLAQVAKLWFIDRMVLLFDAMKNPGTPSTPAGSTDRLLATGCNNFEQGLDIVLEGNAERMIDNSKVERLAAMFATKYEDYFGFSAGDGAFTHSQGLAYVFEIAPVKAFSYRRADDSGATRYRF